MNIILEGPDCAGKTTLATKLLGALLARTGSGEDGITVYHNGVHPDPFHVYLHQAIASLRSPGTIWDRYWPSNEVYLTGELLTPHQIEIMTSLGRELKAVVVMCLPPWKDIHQRWAERIAQEQVQDIHQMAAIYDRYQEYDSGLPQFTIDPLKMGEDITGLRRDIHKRWAEYE